MNGKTKKRLQKGELIPAQRIHILLELYDFLLKDKKRFLWVVRWFQYRMRKDFGLCEFFEINKELQTFCHSCGKTKVSLKKGTKNYCLPTNHGNCAKRKEEKKEHLDECVCTERGALLAD